MMRAPEQWRNRKQFYGAAAEAMRRILVEATRVLALRRNVLGPEHRRTLGAMTKLTDSYRDAGREELAALP